jgi:hypothetical protein
MIREEMLARMSGAEFYAWMALDSIEPFSDVRADIRTGILGSTLANSFEGYLAFNSKNYRPKRYKISDFMPDFDPPVEKTDNQQQRQMATMDMMAAAAAELERRRRLREQEN